MRLNVIALFTVVSLVLVGCNGSTNTPSTGASGTANTDLAGKIVVDGSSTVFPITEAAAAKFKENFASVETTVGLSGTGGGFKRFTKGETDISDASRPIKLSEFEACKANGVEFIELPVAYDGLTIVINKKNTFIKQLTVDQLKRIFLADNPAKTWQDVDPAWPAEEVKIYAPGTDSGTFDYFKEVVAGKKGSFRDDMSTSEDDNVLVNGVAGNEFALGFFGAAYYFKNEDKLASVKIVNPQGDAIAPTAKTIEDGSYAPFSRPLFIYLAKDSIKKAQVSEFVDFYLENASEFATKVGYVPLPESIYEAAKDRFAEEDTGTHYLTAEMEKRSGAVTEVYKKENLTK